MQPSVVPSRGRVTYTIALSNEGPQAAQNVRISDILPTGFSYVGGSTEIYINDTLISTADPLISGQQLSWASALTIPSARLASYYGIHTFVQDRCNTDDINYQLDRALALMGPGAYVKQLFYWITPETPGPLPCWVDFVNRAYDRGLTPVVRLQGVHGGPHWLKPQPDAPGNYTTIAGAYKRVVQGLPRRDGHRLFVEIWNEPNLDIEWSGEPNPTEYAEFLVDVAAAIRSLGDPRIVILNGALAPGGNYHNLAYIDAMAKVSGALQAFDAWATHPYPGNHPPEYNIHDRTAIYPDLTIDSYLLELERLAAHGRTGLQVLLTETGYALGQNNFGFEGYPPISEGNRADYIKRAFRDYWRRWPEVLAVCPYELVDPRGDWWVWDWLYPDGQRHWQYDSVASLEKEAPLLPSQLKIVFQALAASVGGVYGNRVSGTSSNATIPALQNVAPVTVLAPTATPTSSATRTVAATPTATVTGTPPTPTVTPTPTATPPCVEAVANGGFEDAGAWQANRAEYVTEQVHRGQRAVRLGIVDGPNSYSYSSVWQNLPLPAEASLATLTFWYYPISGDVANDLQMARLHDENGNLLAIIMGTGETSDLREWRYKEYDLSAYLGQRIQLYFGVRNDGQGGTTAMYVDDVSILACGEQLAWPTPTQSPTKTATPSPTPSPTWTVTPTSSPTATMGATQTPTCAELIRNPGFEDTEVWEIPSTAYPAQYTEARAHTGHRSLLIGITNEVDLRSYSSARQLIELPADATRIIFSFWYFPISSDQAHDRQYALILDEQNVSLDTLMWTASNQAAWVYREYDLLRYAGRKVKVHFGVYNDGQGGTTAMYVDNVSVWACWGLLPETPTAVPPTMQPYRLHLPAILKTHDPSAQEILLRDPQLSMPAGQGAQPLARWSLPVSGEADYRDTPRLALDAKSRRLYVTWAGELMAFDANNGALLASLRIGKAIHGLTVDSEEGRLYVSDRENGRLWVLSGATMETVATINGIPQPGGIAIAADRIYVAATGGDELWVLDRDTHTVVERISVGRAPYAVAVNPDGRYLLVANAGEASLTAIDRFDTKCKTVVSLEGLGHPQEIAMDVQSAEFYIPYAISPKYYAIAVIDGERLTITRVFQGDAKQSFQGVCGIAVDPPRDRLYVAGANGLLVLDRYNGQVIRTWRATYPAYASGIAVDPQEKRIYTVDVQQIEVTVWQD